MKNKANKTKQGYKMAKKSSARKSSANKSFLSRISNMNTPMKLLLFVAGFTAVGSIAVFALAKPAKLDQRPQGNILAGYSEEGGAISAVKKNNKAEYIQRAARAEVASDGKLYCTPGDNQSPITRTLSADELDKVKSASSKPLGNSNLDSGDKKAIVTSQVVAVKQNGKVQTKSYKNGAEVPSSVPSLLEALCAEGGGQSIPNEEVPVFDAELTEELSKSWGSKLAEFFTPKASAQVDVFNPHTEYGLLLKHNDYRGRNGLGALENIACLNSGARNWTQVMAYFGKLEHSNVVNQYANKYCGQNWRAIGENICRAPGTTTGDYILEGRKAADGCMAGFIASTPHRNNILSLLWDSTGKKINYNKYGVGAYRANNGTIWVALGFWEDLPK